MNSTDSRSQPLQLDVLGKYEFGLEAMDYISAAQIKLNSGNIEECLEIINFGIERKAKPAEALSRARQNALNREKKLWGFPSTKKKKMSMQSNPERPIANCMKSVETELMQKNSVTENQDLMSSSKIFQSITRRRKLNLGPPVKATPKDSKLSRIRIKKLEESPLPTGAMFTPSPPKGAYVAANYDSIKPLLDFEEKENFGGALTSNGFKTPLPVSRHEPALIKCENKKLVAASTTEASILPKDSKGEMHDKIEQLLGNTGCIAQDKARKYEERFSGVNHCLSFSDKDDRLLSNLANSALHISGCESIDVSYRSNTSLTLQAHSNSLIQKPVRSSKTYAGESLVRDPSFAKRTEPRVQRVCEESETCSSESPSTLLENDIVSDCFSDRFSCHTDTNFQSGKVRSSSDSGFSEAALNGITPLLETENQDRKGVLLHEFTKRPDNFNLGLKEEKVAQEAQKIKVQNVTKTDLGNKLPNEVEAPNISVSQTSKISPPEIMKTFSLDGIQAHEDRKPPSDILQSFKMPLAPAPRFPQAEQNKGPALTKQPIELQNDHESNPISTPPSKRKDVSAYLLQRKDAAVASKMKSFSTTKKNKVLHIKKERYKVISVLGKGGSSKVFEVINEDDKAFAMKCVRLDDLESFMFESYLNEIEILESLRNDPYIINLHEYEIKNEVLFMLMEKGEMDLEKYLHLNRTMEDKQMRTIWRQMLCAVNRIHKQGIIHTDLKPANFLFVDSALKLIDFGIAKGLQEDCTSLQRDCLIGTLNYMAPESVSETNHGLGEVDGSKKNYKIRRATDIWSLGCILYLMVYGKTPFQHIKNRGLKVVEITEGRDIAFPDIENKDLLDTMKGCLQRNPLQRYTIDQLLAHPFVTGKNSQIPDFGGWDESTRKLLPKIHQYLCNRTTSPDDDNEMESLKGRDLDLFMQKVKKSAVNSPNSLQRAQKSLAKRGLVVPDGMNPVRKAIF